MSKFIYIGLGKSGSTFLQKLLFREISKILNLKLLNYDEFKTNKIKDNYFISQENLIGEFFSIETWEECLIKNIKNFDKDSNIIIVIRRPIDYFSSYYCQLIHAYIIEKEENFFKTENEIKNMDIKSRYYARYEKFDYKNLVNLYKENFKNVYFIKYEDIKNLNIWCNVFKDKKILKLKFDDVFFNRGYSDTAIKLTFVFENLLRFFNYSLFELQTIVRKFPELKFLPNKITNRLGYELRWRFFIQHRFDKIFPYKKYLIKNNKIRNYLKTKHDKFYDNFKSCYYKGGNLEKVFY